ncbi:LPS assembly lipoprotein LptE [Caulobacter sp. KR2-114]|uniref:LPS assembly lipoprotein LptE n=1 Tax=Caulobacter sp. KR2-114 TaxID=3400912 RepID=UPI003BFC8DA6
MAARPLIRRLRRHLLPQGEKARGALVALGLVAAAAPLAGCGFTPLYAENGVSPGLSSIQVIAPEGRVGYLLRQDLDDELARDKATPAAWRLNLDVGQTRDPRGLREDNTAERYEVQVTVKYTLTDAATGKVATAGQVTSQVSYDAADQPYAGIAAREDTQRRAASDAARRIRLALSVWLAKRNAGGG